MNVFENLIEELKEDNLIESTVLDAEKQRAREEILEKASQFDDDDDDLESHDLHISHPTADADTESTDEANPAEFYRKRAMEEVSSLQMVGNVLTGIEREHMKVAGQVYDDLEAKKALHKFVQFSGDPDSDEHAEARQLLLKETEAWYFALAERDGQISVANLRRFCENSTPALSSQALIALARFYRNAPFTELVRGKFDYVMTRLFSREVEDEKRKLLFGRIEMIGHITTLYSNWSSLSLYSSPDYADLVRVQTLAFSEFAAAAESAASLDNLLKFDVFERVRQTKENLSDMFFTPEITAAAIDCNLRIGNKFVEVVHAERVTTTPEGIEEKYGYTYDQVVSDAAGKTLHLVEILKGAPAVIEKTNLIDEAANSIATYERAPVEEKTGSFSFLRVNKWLLAATLLIAGLSLGLYLWADQYETSQSIASVAAEFDFGGSGVEKYIRSAKRSTETVYGITMPDWELLDEKGQKQVLQNALTYISGKGANKVHLSNGKGRTVGFASLTKVEVYQQ